MNGKKIDHDVWKEEIFEYLKREKFAGITEVANQMNINRNTASRYLMKLRNEGRIDYKEIGRARGWFVITEKEMVINRIRNAKEALDCIRSYEFKEYKNPESFSDIDEAYNSLSRVEEKLSEVTEDS